MTFFRFADRPGVRHPWREFERMHRGMDGGRAGAHPPLNVCKENDEFVINVVINAGARPT